MRSHVENGNEASVNPELCMALAWRLNQNCVFAVLESNLHVTVINLGIACFQTVKD